jgi:acetyltransferase-like isoleucine patch superfamily enzyme
MIRKLILRALQIPSNQFHPLTFIHGMPDIGRNVYIGLFSEVNAKGGYVRIGDNCDIASFVSINIADSHKKCIGLSCETDRGCIILEDNVFVGSHSFIGGRVKVGHHSVISAGCILIADGVIIPPYSLIVGNPYKVKEGYYAKDISDSSSS